MWIRRRLAAVLAVLAAGPLSAQTTVLAPATPFAGLASGDADGAAAVARFSDPKGLIVDGSGDVLVADTLNDTVREISAGGAVTTLAGTPGSPGSGDGADAAAQFFDPSAVAVDAAGDVYVADTPNQLIREITASGQVITVAGTAGTPGSADGQGAAARFHNPGGIAIDGAGNLYVADTFNDTIRKITPGGYVSTLAGRPGVPGSADGPVGSALFNSPNDLRLDAAGDIFVADTANHTIREISTEGVVSTVAGQPGVSGSGDGPAGSARFFDPEGVAVGPAGIYVADTGNDTVRLIANGTVTTVAGIADAAGAGNGLGPYAQFDGPQGIAADSAGNVYVADSLNNTIRRIAPDGTVTTIAGPAMASRLVNLSIRANAGPGEQALVAGFVIGGSGSKTLLVRGVGPGLAQFGVPGWLADPLLTLYGSGQAVLATSAGWDGNAQVAQVGQSVGAFALAPGSADTALVTSLASGAYTAQVTPDSGSGSGVALAELYDADTGTPAARLVNVSARDGVGTGAGVLVAGFSISGNAPETLLIRAIGPTLAQFGVTGWLPAAQLTVYDSAEDPVASNQGWGGSASLQAAFSASGAFALPSGSADAALLINLPPGVYTAQESGAGAATGVGLIEVYEMSRP